MKQYQGEKAIISLTSWKARIKTVGLTIFSLLTNCPGFHIVLVLSEEEFPRKEDELPEDLRLMSQCNKIEILWVYKNYKAFKKVLFTMDKYRDIPVISADDDGVYTKNYAQLLYDDWVNNDHQTPVALWYFKQTYGFITSGYGTLHPPYYFGAYGLDCINDTILSTCEDDSYYCVLRHFLHKETCICKYMPYIGNVAELNDSPQPLHDIYRHKQKEHFSTIYTELSRYFNHYETI